jgi:hypothetical protein
MIGYFDLYRTLAQCQTLPFVDLLQHPPCLTCHRLRM